ncbi:uncharacterized protein LOC112087981 [Eutrema salsugineum]|uniref:uncharacterized protein LOC112087981 n=1 Tax=Eutrema salsugineum TaxID=72664 RepID=UPI000CED79B4|nr:uncharacterized protein LOC112087981 [Eutrema salsugineum]
MMIRGGSLFAKYCRRGMSSSPDLSSQQHKSLTREPTRLSLFLFRSTLLFFGFKIGVHSTGPDPLNAARRESLDDKEKDLEDRMKILDFQEALHAKLELELMNKTSQDQR